MADQDKPLSFEAMVAAALATLAGIPDSEIGQALDSLLGRIGEYIAVDRVAVWERRIGDETPRLHLANYWSAPGVASPAAQIKLSDIPWIDSQLLAEQPVMFSDATALPEEAAADRDWLAASGIHSSYLFPLRFGHEIVGALSLGVLNSPRRWSDVPIEQLAIMADAIAAILAREKTHQLLELREVRYRSFVEQATEGVWCLEFGGSLSLDEPVERVVEQIYSRGRMVEANQAFARMYGYASVQEMGTWRLCERMPRDSATMAMIRTAAESDFQLPDLETREIDVTGSSVVFHNSISGEIVNGRLLRIWGAQRDVTSQSADWDRLNAREQLLRSTMDSLTGQLAVVDRDGIIVRVNRAWTEWGKANGAPTELSTGVGVDYLGACRRASRDGDSWATASLSGLHDLLEGKVPSFEMEYPGSSTAHSKWFHLRAVPLQSDAGGIIAVHTDITEQRDNRLALQKHRDQLAHLGRAAALSEVSAALAHDLSQPLAAIGSNTQAAKRFLDQGGLKDDQFREILEDVIADTGRAGQIVHRSRSLLKQQPASPRAVDLNQTISEVITILQSDALLQGAALELEAGPGLPPVLVDRVQIQQVLLNLLRNGLDSMSVNGGSAGKSIVVRTLRADEAHAQASVCDQGTGLSPGSTVEDLFEAFFTTKPEGLGMGLALSRSIVEVHGGRIWATENDGPGLTFHLTVPFADAQPG